MKYVVSTINFFDNDLKSEIIEADSKIESMLVYLSKEDIKFLGNNPTEDDIKQFYFDIDSMINSIEIPN